MYTSFMLAAKSGSKLIANATFVSEPSVTSEISPVNRSKHGFGHNSI